MLRHSCVNVSHVDAGGASHFYHDHEPLKNKLKKHTCTKKALINSNKSHLSKSKSSPNYLVPL